jgi:xanthine dehydrogenase accessory factor
MTAGPADLVRRMAALDEEGEPYVQVTVVRAQPPTSTFPGAMAVVLADGSLEGFVGGHCAESSVRTAALDALETGDPVLLRILPEGAEAFPEAPGAVTLVNPCLSGGAIELFLAPHLPARRLVVVGDTPIADALVVLGGALSFDVRRDDTGAEVAGATAVVVSSHGRGEDDAIRTALDAGVGFVGLVASPRRGRAVLDELGLTDDERARVRTPVGLDIGARTADEIAVSILAEVVQAVRVGGLGAPPSTADSEAPPTAVDPVCGMTVVAAPPTLSIDTDGVTHWFCNPGCRERFAEQQARDHEPAR